MKNSGKFRKFQKNSENFGKIRKNSENFGKFQKYLAKKLQKRKNYSRLIIIQAKIFVQAELSSKI